MASGVFGVTGPRHFACGVTRGADDGVEGVIIDLQVVRRLNPRAPGFRGGNTRGVPGRLLQRGQYAWRECQRLTGRHIEVQQRLQPTRRVHGQPVADRLTVNAQALGPRLTRLPVPTRQQIKPLQPWLLTTVMFTVSPLLEGGGIFADAW
jgi:hypothetical protein